MTNVQLPNLAVESQRIGLRADVRTSLRFCNNTSGSGAVVSSANDILRQRNEDDLWIIPAPACRLRVSVHLLGRISGQSLEKRAMASCIAGCEIWKRLKLRVRHCEGPDDSMLEFSIQHPDLSASLICPSTAARTELQSIECRLEISTAAEPRRKRKRRQQDEFLTDDENLVSGSQGSIFSSSGLNADDRVAVHDFVAGLDSRRNERIGTPGSTAQIPRQNLEILVRAAVTALVTGSTRHFADVKVRQSSTAHALVKLAPAVFNVPYVKSISERARHIDVIANAVAAMQQAQSPRLRLKVNALIGDAPALESIGQCVWSAIVSQVKPPSVPALRAVASLRSNEMTQEIMQEVVMDHTISSDSSDLICFGEDPLFPDLGVVFNESDDMIQTEETSPIIQIDYDAFESDFQFGPENLMRFGFSNMNSERAGNPHIEGTESMIEFGSQFYVMGEMFSM